MKHFFTSESVTRGHPDKVCDQIADAVLDDILEHDLTARVACEVTAVTEKVHIMGEITSTHMPDFEKIARSVIRDIGYTKHGCGFDADNCKIELDIHGQSPDIALGINRRYAEDNGAGDQGMMFGYACGETAELMPLPISLANKLSKRLEYVRTSDIIPNLLPDGKTQVTVEYDDGKPVRVSAVIVSTQHESCIDIDTLRKKIVDKVVLPTLPDTLIDDKTSIFINPTGRFTLGGPAADSGLTGRKIIADTYGGYSRHGGGSFSGKDPTKVDKSGAYMARYIAKNIVSSGMADRCEVQLAYAIGLAEPVSVYICTFSTGRAGDDIIAKWVCDNIDMRPEMIIRRFNLRAPIYSRLSCGGHFGENAHGMGWEKTDLAEKLRHDMQINI
ncbi:MAG: methionine adenosyltransferase [Oscillospiraceae bacterium]|nr:methionine adenosyltransferase [Oscillospiraceae bacterium]